MIDLSKITTHELVDALMERAGVQYIVNDRSSAATYVAVDFKRGMNIEGESVTINVKGLF